MPYLEISLGIDANHDIQAIITIKSPLSAPLSPFRFTVTPVAPFTTPDQQRAAQALAELDLRLQGHRQARDEAVAVLRARIGILIGLIDGPCRPLLAADTVQDLRCALADAGRLLEGEHRATTGAEFEHMRVLLDTCAHAAFRTSLPSRVFDESSFAALYAAARVPGTVDELLQTLSELITAHGRAIGATQNELDLFQAELLQEHLNSVAGLPTSGDAAVAVAAQRMWTSNKTLRGRELCSIINAAIRADCDSPLLAPVALIVRAINKMCITRLSVLHGYPADGVCYRGSGLPDEHRAFYDCMVGSKYRVPGFLATSLNRGTAELFYRRAYSGGLPAVLYRVYVDPRGKDDPALRCLHVNLIKPENHHFAGETEFLFVPYSVFTVLSVAWAAGTPTDPHIVSIEAARDNQQESATLPLVPYY